MRLLLDANIYLEALLMQDSSEDVISLLNQYKSHEFYISDFTLHVVGLRLFRSQSYQEYLSFVNDVLLIMNTQVLSINIRDMQKLTENAIKYKLDFDDAYQYTLAERDNLILVSFDSDFDKTERGRMKPYEILKQ